MSDNLDVGDSGSNVDADSIQDAQQVTHIKTITIHGSRFECFWILHAFEVLVRVDQSAWIATVRQCTAMDNFRIFKCYLDS